MRLIDGLVIAFIWDFDGVIVHTPHEKAWAIASQVYGAEGFNHEFYRRYVSGRPRLEGGRLILELLGVYEKRNITTEADKEKLLKEFTNYKNGIYLSLIRRGEFKVNWDAIKFIIKAKEQGVIQVLASASKNAWSIANMVEVEGYGKLVNIFDIDVSGLGKTKAEVFSKAMNLVRQTYNSINYLFIVFEDSLQGLHVAKSLGMKTVYYGNTLESTGLADYHISSFKSLDPISLIKALRCN